MSDHASSSTVTQVAQNSVFERFARAGYVVSGLLHLAIGYLAIRIALVSGGGTADQSGALAAVAAKPGGIAALWVAAVAFLIMALWRLVETALGRSTDPKSQGGSSEVLDRVKAFALAVVYFGLAYSTFGFARGAGKSTGAQNAGISARLMQTGAGTIGLIAAGIIIVAVGAYHVCEGASRTFLDDLKGTLQRPGATTGHGGLNRQRPRDRRCRGAGHRRGESFGAQQGHRTRRCPQNTRGPTLRTSAPDRGRPWNPHLRLLQLRHGAIHQNVSESGDSASGGHPRGLSRECKKLRLSCRFATSAARSIPRRCVPSDRPRRAGWVRTCAGVRLQLAQRARTGTRIDPFRSCGCRLIDQVDPHPQQEITERTSDVREMGNIQGWSAGA